MRRHIDERLVFPPPAELKPAPEWRRRASSQLSLFLEESTARRPEPARVLLQAGKYHAVGLIDHLSAQARCIAPAGSVAARAHVVLRKTYRRYGSEDKRQNQTLSQHRFPFLLRRRRPFKPRLGLSWPRFYHIRSGVPSADMGAGRRSYLRDRGVIAAAGCT
jgi:hypothetical protein